MSNDTPSPGAVKAAEIIYEDAAGKFSIEPAFANHDPIVQNMAEVIDQETGVKELVLHLRSLVISVKLLKEVCEERGILDFGPLCATEQAEVLLAKHEGGGNEKTQTYLVNPCFK